MNAAVMLGAGQIGRGFIGMLLHNAGYRVLFADLDAAVVNDINARKEYTVHLVDTQCVDTVVTDVSAVSALDESLPDAYARCSLICTAIGLTALPKAAPAIAAGLKKRRLLGVREPLNIIACENAIRASSILKSRVYELLDGETAAYAEEYVGFPDCAVDRIIPPMRGSSADVTAERYHEWDVERSGFKGAVPAIDGMKVVDELERYLERKLFTLNGPNAVTACMGYERGYATINEALEDGGIFKTVYGMMEECGRMLEQRHGFSADEMREYRDRLIERFKNPYVIDSCTRVAREPMRKLAPGDRLIPTMVYAESCGIPTPCYYAGIASVLLYDNPAEPQSVELQRLINSLGVRAALERICGVAAASPAAAEIEREYLRLREELKKR